MKPNLNRQPGHQFARSLFAPCGSKSTLRPMIISKFEKEKEHSMRIMQTPQFADAHKHDQFNKQMKAVYSEIYRLTVIYHLMPSTVAMFDSAF